MVIAPFCPECGAMMIFRFAIFGYGGDWYCEECGCIPKTVNMDKTEVEG